MLAAHFIQSKDMMTYLLDVAAANEKPVIAIRAFGGMSETPDELVSRVKEQVQWAARDIADAVKREMRLFKFGSGTMGCNRFSITN